MSHVQKFVIAASLFAAAVFPSLAFGQLQPHYFIDERPAIAAIGDYTNAAYTATVALNASSANSDYAKAVAHARTADDFQNAIEGLYYYVSDKPRYAAYTYDPIFMQYYLPMRDAQITYSLYASNDIVNGVMNFKRGRWTTSSLTAYSLNVKAMELGQYDREQE